MRNFGDGYTGRGMSDEIMRLAQNLARTCGYAVFPMRLVGNKKLPTRPEKDGGHGFKDATKDPDGIAWLWQHWPGPLIGIATGPASGISVLDVDVGHPEAYLWWQDRLPRIPATRAYRSRSGGLHLYFQHLAGITSTASKLAIGLDTRGDGGCATFWFAAGSECLDHTPPAPWPPWLAEELRRATAPPPSPPTRRYRPLQDNEQAALDGLLRKLAGTPDGQRNAVLFWTACRLAERGMTAAQIEAVILPTCQQIGLVTALDLREIRGSIKSACRRAAA
jgi:hypothetical protein